LKKAYLKAFFVDFISVSGDNMQYGQAVRVILNIS
jgi:hypothetical protein